MFAFRSLCRNGMKSVIDSLYPREVREASQTHSMVGEEPRDTSRSRASEWPGASAWITDRCAKMKSMLQCIKIVAREEPVASAIPLTYVGFQSVHSLRINRQVHRANVSFIRGK
jgi:hypothetical protein